MCFIPQIRRADIKWKTADALFRSIDALDSGPKWNCKIMKVEGDLDSDGTRQVEYGELWYRDIIDVHGHLLGNPDLAEGAMWTPSKEYMDSSKKNRLYSEAMTGDWAWNTQVLFCLLYFRRITTN